MCNLIFLSRWYLLCMVIWLHNLIPIVHRWNALTYALETVGDTKARLAGHYDLQDGVEYVERVCPQLLSAYSDTFDGGTRYIRVNSSKSQYNYIFPVVIKIRLEKDSGTKISFEPSSRVDFRSLNVSPRDIFIARPINLTYLEGRLTTKFRVENREYSIYPADDADLHYNNKSINETFRALNSSTIYNYFIDCESGGNETLNHIIYMYTSSHSIDDENGNKSEWFYALDKKREWEEELLRNRSFLIEGAMFVDEYDMPNVTEVQLTKIAEEVDAIFINMKSVNIRFTMVSWFAYPKDWVLPNAPIIKNQRKFEEYLSTFKELQTFDVAMLLSTRVIETVKEGYVVGWANVGTMCRRGKSALVAWNKPGYSAWYISHELTHLLNSYHDNERSCPKGSQLPDQPYIDSDRRVHWSNCTISVITDYIKAGKLDCLLDENHKKETDTAQLNATTTEIIAHNLRIYKYHE